MDGELWKKLIFKLLSMSTSSIKNPFDSLRNIWSLIILILWLLLLGTSILQRVSDARWAYWNYGYVWWVLMPSILLFFGLAYLIFIIKCMQSRKDNTQVSLWKMWWKLGFLWVFILDIFLFAERLFSYLFHDGLCHKSWWFPWVTHCNILEYALGNMDWLWLRGWIVLLFIYPIFLMITGYIISFLMKKKS